MCVGSKRCIEAAEISNKKLRYVGVYIQYKIKALDSGAKFVLSNIHFLNQTYFVDLQHLASLPR